MRVKYSKELLEPIVKESFSYAEVCRKLGLRDGGSNFRTIREKIALYELDTSHFTGPRWNKGLSSTETTALIPLNLILKENTNYKSFNLKNRLIKLGIKENKCEECGLLGEGIILELHHINGNHYDNRLENLQILCPNCHSKTSNFRNRNACIIEEPEHFNSSLKPKICENCGKEFRPQRKSNRFCSRECYTEFLKKVGTLNKNHKSGKLSNLTKEYILEHIENFSNMSDFSKFLNVSRPTLRKYLDEYGLLEDFKFKFDFRATKVNLYDLDGNLIKTWPSITDAENTLNITSISKVINGRARSAGGFLWKKAK